MAAPAVFRGAQQGKRIAGKAREGALYQVSEWHSLDDG
jgi:hypothetical protein